MPSGSEQRAASNRAPENVEERDALELCEVGLKCPISVLEPSARRANLSVMLDLRPVCENCEKALPPASLEARICSFECTFCADCVERVLLGVCPNCAGGFCSRPVRPVREWRAGESLTQYPPTEKRRVRPVDAEAHRLFAERIALVPAHER